MIEAIETLRGEGPADLTALCVELAARMLTISNRGSYEECKEKVLESIRSGEALRTFALMVEAQGGDSAYILDPSRFPAAKYAHAVKATEGGYLASVDTEGYGTASLILGAGRNTKDDVIDPAAGIRLLKKTGDRVAVGEEIAILYTERKETIASAEERLLQSTRIAENPPPETPLVLAVVE